MTLEELKVVITAETSGLKKELDSLKTQLNKTEKTVTKTTGGIKKALSSLTKGFTVTAIVYGLLKVGKQAVQTASDLQEVQNVVDVSFGSMSAEVDKFAENAIKQFGLSKLSAKQFASTFMAMSNGMGVAAEAGKNMSLNLTALAADMASFYNVEQDVAFTALKSVFTGETESLKRFGIVMTEANLEAYALSQGITKSYSAMSQAEKVALRYSFVLNATKNAQGDFARTSNNWANQVRILKEQFKELAGIIGNGLLKVLQPLIILLNKVLGLAISVANAISQAFGGKKIKESSTSVGNMASGMGDIASGAEDTSSGLESADKSAKKLKRTLAGFDQLNVLSTSDSGSSTSSGAGGGDITGLANASYISTEEEVESGVSKADEYFKQVSEIYHKWFDNLPKLKINFDKEQALEDIKNIGLDIINVLAGLGSFVITIGINLANDLDIGKLANDFLSLISSITNLASTIVDILEPAFVDLYNTALSPIVKWIGEKLSDAIQFVRDIINDFADFLKEHKAGIQGWIDIIGKLVAVIWKVIEPIADAAWEIFKAVLKQIYEIVKYCFGAFLDLGELLSNILNDPTNAFKYFGEFVEKRFKSLIGLLKNFKEFVGTILVAIAKMLVENFKNLITNAKSAVSGVKEAFRGIPEWFRTTFTNAWTNVKNVFSKGGKVFTGIKDGILSGLKSVVNALIGGINKVISIPFNGLNKALNKIRNISILGKKPFYGLIGNIAVPQIPKLAKGGVITSPTIAMMGEYAGAKTNPEIVTPQSILKETISNSNDELINALLGATGRIIKAINDSNVTLEGDAKGMFKIIKKEADNYTYRTGKPAFI